MPRSRIMSLLGIRSVTVRYGLIHLSSPVTRCHHHRQGSAPSFSNSSQTGGGGGSGVCTELLLELEPLLDDDDDEPLDDELPDDDDDVVLSSSLSTSFFARRGLSLTPPRRGLSLMPRLSICNVVTGWSCAVAWFWGCLARSREPGLLTGWCRHSTRGAGLAACPHRRACLERSAVREDDSHRLFVQFRGCGIGVSLG